MFVACQAALRAWRRSAPSPLTSRVETLLLLALVITSAGGLGLMAGGARPREPLHFVYAALALAALPVANSFAGRWEPRRLAVATLLAALVVLAVVARLFGTG